MYYLFSEFKITFENYNFLPFVEKYLQIVENFTFCNINGLFLEFKILLKKSSFYN